MRNSKYTGPGPEFPEEDFLGLPESGYLDLPDFQYLFSTPEERANMPEWKKKVLREESGLDTRDFHKLIQEKGWVPISGSVLYTRLFTEKEGKKYLVADLTVNDDGFSYRKNFASSIEDIETEALRKEKDVIEVSIDERTNPHQALEDAMISYYKRFRATRADTK